MGSRRSSEGSTDGVEPGRAAPRKKELVLAFIIDWLARWDRAPSYREIAVAQGISVQRVGQLVDQLARDGLIERTPGGQRALRVVDVAETRLVLTEVLRRLGFAAPAEPGHIAPAPLTQDKLPMLPDPDYPPEDGRDARGVGW